MSDVEKCHELLCKNDADPRFFVHDPNGAPLPSCDAHGCMLGQRCFGCRAVDAYYEAIDERPDREAEDEE